MTALNAMLDADYLRRQADTCLRMARTTFDLETAERLRFLAIDLRAKAAELDDQTTLEPHVRAIVSSSSRPGRK